jgi:dienelactone hydrolase
MVPIANRIAQTGERRLAVFRVLNSRRGWDTQHTPVVDTRWALDRVAERLGQTLPACLVGHSLGGRAALLTAGRAEVQSVVALAPYVYPADIPASIDGKRILIVHGSADRVASPKRSLALADSLGQAGADVTYVTVEGGKHSMLGRRAIFDRAAAQFVAWTLLGAPVDGPISEVEAGARRLSI